MITNTFFLRVTASCNLDCDYCYVFKHRDMSWKYMPAIIKKETVIKFAERLKEYADKYLLKKLNIIFHGGEPLVCGENKILEFIDIIDSILGKEVQVSYSMQTNGTLLTESFLKICEQKNIGISLSIDGYKCIHDKHRKYKNGEGSFNDVMRGINILKKYPSVFEGVIGVIDPTSEPEKILSFFDELNIENVDLLLPDSTYMDLPEGRDKQPELYTKWLIKAFDSWFFNHQSIQLRTFEHILISLLGKESSLDAFGLGNLDYLTIETDGTYHTSDILKVAYENASFIGFDVNEGSIEDALNSEKVKEYNELLSVGKLPSKCKKCIYSEICGGGSLPHRYNENTRFDNPSIYCNEIYSLISHASNVVESALNEEDENV